jgi:hypothetical protein
MNCIRGMLAVVQFRIFASLYFVYETAQQCIPLRLTPTPRPVRPGWPYQ